MTKGQTGALWYYFNATANGKANVTTAGSSIDTVLNRYEGRDKCSLLICYNFNDDVSATDNTSSIEFSVIKGTTYHLSVSGKAKEFGLIKINIRMIGQDFIHLHS